MKKSFLAWYLFVIFFLFSCSSIEVKENEVIKQGKFSLASDSEYFSGTLIVNDNEKKIKINLDGLSKNFKILFDDEKIKTNFRYENIIKTSDLKLFLKWFLFKCTKNECKHFSLQSLKLEKYLSDKTGLIIRGNFHKYRLSLKLNDI